MAGVLSHVSSGEVTLIANTAKTVLQIKAPANQRLIVQGLRLFGKQPAGGTDTPIKVRLTRSTANFGTGSSVTPSKNDPTDSETLQISANANFSAEPTSPTDGGLWFELPPQSGIIDYSPPGLQIKIPGGQSVQFEATSTGTPTLMFSATVEE